MVSSASYSPKTSPEDWFDVVYKHSQQREKEQESHLVANSELEWPDADGSSSIFSSQTPSLSLFGDALGSTLNFALEVPPTSVAPSASCNKEEIPLSFPKKTQKRRQNASEDNSGGTKLKKKYDNTKAARNYQEKNRKKLKEYGPLKEECDRLKEENNFFTQLLGNPRDPEAFKAALMSREQHANFTVQQNKSLKEELNFLRGKLITSEASSRANDKIIAELREKLKQQNALFHSQSGNLLVQEKTISIQEQTISHLQNILRNSNKETSS